MKRKSLLFACIEKNIGDDLFVYIVCKRYPHVNFLISDNARYGSLSRIENLSFSKRLKYWLKSNDLEESNNIFKSIVGTIFRKLFSISLLSYKNAVYIVGNAFKNTNYLGKKQSKWISNRVNLVDDFFLLSTNFGPYNDELWKIDCELIFARMKDVCFRDEFSARLFCEKENIRYHPDAVLSIGKQKRKDKCDKLIVISVIDCLLPVREKDINECARKYELCIVNIIGSYLEKGYKVVLLNSNTQQDDPASIRIKNAINDKLNLLIENYEGDLQRVFNLYERAEMIIATRFHAVVLAWLYNVPVIPISYDIKTENLLETCHFSGEYFDIHDLDKLTPKLVEKIYLEYTFELDDSIIIEADKQFEGTDEYFERRNNK